jgi:hypothetical protein
MLIGLLFLAFMIFLLVAFLRFTVVSDWRTRGAEGRLRYPAPSEVAGIVGFAPPADLVPFFEQAPFVEKGEFQLVDRAHGAGRAWDISHFTPLTARALNSSENRRRMRRVPVRDPISDIVSTFRKMSTESDQAQGRYVRF